MRKLVVHQGVWPPDSVSNHAICTSSPVSQSAASFSVTMRRFSKITFGFEGACVTSMPTRKYMVDSATGPASMSMQLNFQTSDLATGVIGIIADRRSIANILHSRSGFLGMQLTRVQTFLSKWMRQTDAYPAVQMTIVTPFSTCRMICNSEAGVN
jgi:hypothetical protein